MLSKVINKKNIVTDIEVQNIRTKYCDGISIKNLIIEYNNICDKQAIQSILWGNDPKYIVQTDEEKKSIINRKNLNQIRNDILKRKQRDHLF